MIEAHDSWIATIFQKALASNLDIIKGGEDYRFLQI